MASYSWNETNGTLVIEMTENVEIGFATDKNNNNYLVARLPGGGKFTATGNDKATDDGTET